VKFWNLDLIFAALMLKEMMQNNPRANRVMRGCVIARHFWKSNMSEPLHIGTQKRGLELLILKMLVILR
jgi:hypothetical protein